MTTSWEAVIGLEIHVQLSTRSKIFSGASTAYGAEPNTQACAIDLGMPGTLPVLNAEAVRKAVQFGLAVEAQIAQASVFARKNYFYPDLPKGYQISQMELPIVGRGHLDIEVDGHRKRIGITRAHLEEDAGKSLHESFHGMSGIDLNRAGTPLLEIVSEPDLRSAQEAVAYMRKLHELVRFLDICDGNMQEGSFRCDANVSVRPAGQRQFGTRVEIKNINSFKFVEKAIEHEIGRQTGVLASGGRVVQETRLYDADQDRTRPMRSKEEANDYRYFPDPDLLPVVISEAFKAELRAALPELPEARRRRFGADYSLDPEAAALLTASRALADYFEEAVRLSGAEARLCANWINGEVQAALNRQNLDIGACPVSAPRLAGLLRRLSDGTISGKIAKTVFEALWQDAASDADAVIDAKGLRQISDGAAIAAVIGQIVAANPKQVAQYQAGNDKVFGFFVGQVMKAMQGKANPAEVNKMLEQRLRR